jgi:hypothetical protein
MIPPSQLGEVMDGTLARGYPQRQQRLPVDFSAVNRDWLTGLLQLKYPGVIVDDAALVEFVGGHSSKARMALKLNSAGREAGFPGYVCLKSNWSGNPMSAGANLAEARFYRNFAGRLPSLTPQCFFADWDDDGEGQQGLIVLEDLKKRGAEFRNSKTPLTVDQMASSLELLAQLHGSTWDSRELAQQRWLQVAMAPETTVDDYWTLMGEHFPLHNSLPERLAIFPRWLAEDPGRLRKAFQQLSAEEMASTKPRCLIHGDSHLGNTCGLPDGSRLWFDWQIVRRGRPWRDYSYFVVGSLSVEDRRRNERELLRVYCEAMAGQGVKIDFDEAFVEYRRWIFWGLWGWQSNMNPIETTMEPLQRFCVAAEDLETHTFFGY